MFSVPLASHRLHWLNCSFWWVVWPLIAVMLRLDAFFVKQFVRTELTDFVNGYG